MAGRDRRSNESAAGTDAARLYPDDDERLWTGDVLIEKRSEQQSGRDGAQAGSSERLIGNFLIGSFWEFVGATIKS